jgi:hypothetical protein
VLDVLIKGQGLSEWTMTTSGSTATFTAPGGYSFQYDETEGSIS